MGLGFEAVVLQRVSRCRIYGLSIFSGPADIFVSRWRLVAVTSKPPRLDEDGGQASAFRAEDLNTTPDAINPGEARNLRSFRFSLVVVSADAGWRGIRRKERRVEPCLNHRRCTTKVDLRRQ